jgi:hypothetical protein
LQHLPVSKKTIEDDIDSIGGESLSGSGFEAEEPESDFTGVDPEAEE